MAKQKYLYSFLFSVLIAAMMLCCILLPNNTVAKAEEESSEEMPINADLYANTEDITGFYMNIDLIKLGEMYLMKKFEGFEKLSMKKDYIHEMTLLFTFNSVRYKDKPLLILANATVTFSTGVFNWRPVSFNENISLNIHEAYYNWFERYKDFSSVSISLIVGEEARAGLSPEKHKIFKTMRSETNMSEIITLEAKQLPNDAYDIDSPNFVGLENIGIGGLLNKLPEKLGCNKRFIDWWLNLSIVIKIIALVVITFIIYKFIRWIVK